MKEIQLFDSEQGKTHTFMVSDENYEEITTNNNLTLAAVLEKEQEKDNFKAAFNVMQSNRQTSKSSQAHSTVTAVSGNDDSNSLITATPTRDGQVDGLAGTLNDSENNSSSNNQNTPSFHSSFMKKRKVTENAAERRHREKMARQDRYLDLLDRLTTAVEKNTGNPKNN
ncbi:hypothetical protein JTB14_025557 [Gonioctena quinquepunctata]|nr:hypothetical protein JTB14_025557 [Gonioctena quinquepunctata]